MGFFLKKRERGKEREIEISRQNIEWRMNFERQKRKKLEKKTDNCCAVASAVRVKTGFSAAHTHTLRTA